MTGLFSDELDQLRLRLADTQAERDRFERERLQQIERANVCDEKREQLLVHVVNDQELIRSLRVEVEKLEAQASERDYHASEADKAIQRADTAEQRAESAEQQLQAISLELKAANVELVALRKRAESAEHDLEQQTGVIDAIRRHRAAEQDLHKVLPHG